MGGLTRLAVMVSSPVTAVWYWLRHHPDDRDIEAQRRELERLAAAESARRERP